MKFDFDDTDFERGLAAAERAIARGAERGMHDATDDLLRESRDLAPLDKATLRRGSWKEIEEADGSVIGDVYYSAVEKDRAGNRFNYALYMHEFGGHMQYANPTTPGTQPKYLEQPLKMYSDRYMKMIAEEIRRELT
ncbi:HK97 gp10 family phage protein [Paenibacillus xanthanilyticus]|uniref:HK97 gp10 family phage protein n=1 Tax=Paenibacillus xanthanilyticus TaxID=1783531 RepID=A0ABV8KC28_9BACL